MTRHFFRDPNKPMAFAVGGRRNVVPFNPAKRITPEQLAACGTEHGEQSALFCWANDVREQYPILQSMFSIPNGGERGKATAARLKAEGVKSGVSDIFLPVVRQRFEPGLTNLFYHGLFVEMKKLRATNIRNNDPQFGATDDQRAFIKLMHERGYAAVVCHGWLEARDVILSYLKLPA